MKVDFHVQLEEGPYTLKWLHRTAESLRLRVGTEEEEGSRSWADQLVRGLADRLRLGPYSREWLDLYRARAKQVGIGAVCIVEPLFRFVEYAHYYEKNLHLADDRLGHSQRRWLRQVSSESLSAYVAFLKEEQKRWAEDGIELKVGIELDYFPGGEEVLSGVIHSYPWDVCMGAVHFIQGWGFHNPDTQERFDRMELHALYGRYFDLVEQAIQSRLFDLIARVDGLKIFGHRPDETSLLSYYQRVARALSRWDVATEINTGVFLHAPAREMSPSYRLLEILAQHDVAVTTSSNALYPEQVGQHLSEARTQLRRAGFQSIAYFDKRNRSLLPLD
jgi:histidinol-phosphatase (PHP family)